MDSSRYNTSHKVLRRSRFAYSGAPVVEKPIFVETDEPFTDPDVTEMVENIVPEGLLDFVRENEPYGETQARLWSMYLELNGKLMLGLATEEEARLHTRLHGHLAWISKGAVEVTRD